MMYMYIQMYVHVHVYMVSINEITCITIVSYYPHLLPVASELSGSREVSETRQGIQYYHPNKATRTCMYVHCACAVQ